MAEEKEIKVEKEVKVESKKLDDLKETPENKAAIAEADGRNLNTDDTDSAKGEKEEVKEKKVESKPAVAKAEKGKDKKKKEVVELEREYIVPLKKGVLNVPHYRRAKKAVRVLKEFIVQHMKVRDRDLDKVKIDINLNNEIWFRGIKKPMNKVKVKAKKIDGIVYVELAEIPEYVGFKIAREARKKAEAAAGKVKTPKKVEEKVDDDKDKDGVSDKKEEKEDAKAGSEMDAKIEKTAAKTAAKTTKGSHGKKVAPVRKVLK